MGAVLVLWEVAVDVFDVHLKVGLDVGRVGAVGAGEGLHGEVDVHVPLEVPQPGEGPAAHGARERRTRRGDKEAAGCIWVGGGG